MGDWESGNVQVKKEKGKDFISVKLKRKERLGKEMRIK